MMTKSPTTSLPAVPAMHPDDDDESRFMQWLPWIIIVLLLIAVPIGIWLSTRVGDETKRADQTQQVLDNTAAQARTLAQQIADECAAGRLHGPVCQTADEVRTDPVVIEGPAGTPGAAGQMGPRGLTGPTGPPGPPPPCMTEPSQCQGQDGVDGADGKDGQDGKDGADGAPGRDGSPAVRMTKTYADGSVETCDRSGGPDTAPEYACTQTTPPAPPPGG